MNVLCTGIKYSSICAPGTLAQHEEDSIVVKPTLVHYVLWWGKGM